MGNLMNVHVMAADKFIEPFIAFIDENFDLENHTYLVTPFKHEVQARENVVFLNASLGRWKKLFVQVSFFYKANKIILHGLFDIRMVIFLFFQPWLLKKCYWVMWGGDLYCYMQKRNDWRWKLKEWVRGVVIKRIGHLVTYIPGDVDLAREWYGAKGEYHECFMYPSNLYKEYIIPDKKGSSKNILLGNSGDPSNNHFELFDKLLPYKDDDIKIYCPLSYGDEHHIQDVVKKGHALFGSKFIPLLEFMPFEKYLELLGQVDIAMFGHKRQQAMGNTITLLGLGKKVYMRNDVTSYEYLCQVGFEVFSVDDMDISKALTIESSVNNKRLCKKLFNKHYLVYGLKEMYKA